MTLNRKLAGLTFFLCIAMHCIEAQRVMIAGQVTDQSTHQPLSSAFITTSTGKWISDANGRFSVSVIPGDTITISHIGYETVYLSFFARVDTLAVELKLETVFLKAISIRSYNSEEELKEKILQTPVIESQEVQNAKNNLLKIRTLYLLGYRPQMNNYERFQYSMKPAQGVTFFSSSGGGLLKVLKDFSYKPAAIYKPINSRSLKPSGLFFMASPQKRDSVKSDSVLVFHK
jgi:hypothetical protein